MATEQQLKAMKWVQDQIAAGKDVNAADNPYGPNAKQQPAEIPSATPPPVPAKTPSPLLTQGQQQEQMGVKQPRAVSINELTNLTPQQLAANGGYASIGGNTLAYVPKNPPTVATPQQPLISKGGNAPEIPTPLQVQDPQKALENIAYKKMNNQILTEDENRFLIRQSLQGYQAPKSPAQDIQPSGTDYGYGTSGGYYRAPSNPNMPLKTPLPSQYKTEEEFANANPEAYDLWASQNGYHYSQDGMNYYPNKPGDVNFTVDDFVNATPEEQMAMRQQAFLGMSKKQVDFLNNAFDQMIKQNQDKYDTTKTALESDNAAKVAEFAKTQEAQAAEAAARITKAGAAEEQNIKDMQSFSGFGRSTKSMELLQNASEDTKARIADIERQKGQAISEFQMSLVDKMQTRLDKISEIGDQLQITKMQKSLDLTTDLMKQDPSNPEEMFKMSQEIQKNKIDMAKLSLDERKQIHTEAMNNFKFMVDNYGSKFTENMSNDDVQTLGENLGIAPNVLRNLGKTMAEQKDEWEKLKYVDTQNFELKKMGMQWDFDTQKIAQQQGFDIDKMRANQQFEIDKMVYGKQLDNQKYANVGYGDYKANATGSLETGSFTYEGNPVPHPYANTTVVELNPKLAQAYPDGYRFKASQGAGGLGGQCLWFAEQLTTLDGKPWAVGNTLAQKKASLNRFIKQGLAFKPGQQEAQVGNTILTTDSATYGHGAVINAITPEGKWVLSEANYKGPLTVSNTRIVDPNDPRIFGVLKTEPIKKYQVDQTATRAPTKQNPVMQTLDDLAQSGAFGAFGKAINPLGKVIGKSIQTQAGNQANARIEQQRQSDIAAGKIDENGMAISKDRQQVRSGKLSETVLNKMYTRLEEAVNAGALPPEALDQFTEDMAYGQDKAIQMKDQRELAKTKDKDLPAAVRANIANVNTAMRSLDEMESMFNEGNGPARFTGTWGDTPYQAKERMLIETIGRLQSQGAINKEEIVSFKGMLPGINDSDEVKQLKYNQARQFLQDKLNAYGGGGSSGGGYSSLLGGGSFGSSVSNEL